MKQRTPSGHAVFIGQILLNAALVLAGLWLLWWGNRRALFVIAIVPLVFVPFSYARLRLHRHLESHLSGPLVALLCAAGVVFDCVMAAQLLSARQTETSLLQAPGVTWIGAVWFSAHAMLLLGYGVGALALWGAKPVRRRVSRPQPPARTAESLELGRRELLQKAGLLTAALPFGISLSGVPLSYDFRIETREIVLPFWPAALDGLRVVHLSDIHVGGSMDLERLTRVAELTNECRPDLVLHSGDFLTHRLGAFDEPLYQALARVRATYGQWACFGNHDYDNAERLQQRLQDCGVVVLRNRVAPLTVQGQPLEIAGVDFIFTRSQRISAYEQTVAAWGERHGTPRILLNHDPTTFQALPPACADLVLSGHTHGGHIGVQLSSTQAITVVGLVGLPDQGLYEHADMRMYVTRCVGFYGYPMRIGIPPEIALLILRSPQAVTQRPTA